MTISTNFFRNFFRTHSGITSLDRVVLYPYKISSSTSSVLKAELINQGIDCIKVYPDRNYNPKKSDLIINLGNSTVPNWMTAASGNIMFNKPEAIAISANKLKTFTKLKDAGFINIPEFTTNTVEASEMIEDGFSIYARTIVTGHSGAGIVFCAPGGTPLPVAPLYTKLASCKHEYRVHVWGDNVIDVAQKKKRSRPEEGEEGYETWQEPSTIIRNHDNGYVFCHGGVSLSTEIKDLCIEATKIMKLDFTAIDIIVDRNGRPTILEFNSVPGMSVTDDGEPSITMTKYIESIKSVINSINE